MYKYKNRQSLSGGTMKVVQLLALFHFIFGIIYSIGLMIVSKVSGLVVLFFVLPISITITIFYIWILAALNNSIKNLKTSTYCINDIYPFIYLKSFRGVFSFY